MSPVDSLAPKASAIKVTMITAIPLMPDLEIPKINEAIKAIIQEVVEISNAAYKTMNDVRQTKNKCILKNNIFMA